MLRAFILSMMFGVVAVSVGDASTWHVDASVGTSGDGTSWETAFRTIQEALDSASDGDTIIVARGTYSWVSIKQRKGLCVQSINPLDSTVVEATRIGGVSIWGAKGSAIEGFTISSDEGTLVFCRNSPNVSILNNVIVGCDAYAESGLILCVDCSPLIAGNVIARNTGGFHGAIYCERSSPTIINNTIAHNAPRSGLGGIVADDQSFPTITNCIIWDNGEDLFNCTVTYSCIKDAYGGEGNIAMDPRFISPNSCNYQLLSYSPCIDTGDPASEFSLEPEPNGGRINMGAYGNTPSAALKSSDADSDGLPDDWEMSVFWKMDYRGTDDKDGDGIPNIEEYRYGWDPSRRDAISAKNVATGRIYPTIQAAICEATDGDVLVVPPGTHRENISFFGRAITLRSIDPADPAVVASTILEGPGTGSVVKFCSGELPESLLTGFTIMGGKALRGGGIHCWKSSPTIYGNVVSDNENYPGEAEGWTSGTMSAGGGIYSFAGSPTIENNMVIHNSSGMEGAGIACRGGTPIIRGNTVANNGYLEGTYGSGGGISVREGSPLIVGNNIVNNHSNWGGGIYLFSADAAIIAHNRISGNEASDGDGLHICDGNGLLLAGNMVTNNTGWESAIFVRGHMSLHIVNCTVAMNARRALSRGCLTVQSSVVFTNCIIWGSGEPSWPSWTSATHCCLEIEDPGDGNFVADPVFVDPLLGDFRLQPGSPCIDAGTNHTDGLPETDVLGLPRILFGGRSRTVDMGAHEYYATRADLAPNGETVLSWSSVTDKRYTVFYSNDLVTWVLAKEGVPSTGNRVTSWTDDGFCTGVPPLLVPRRFYRIVEDQ